MCVLLGAPCMSNLAFCNLCLNEGRVVLDARLSTLYPEHKILSTLVSQSCKSHTAKGSLCVCWNCSPKSTNFTWVHGGHLINSVTLGPAWGCPPAPRSQAAHASPSAAQRASLPSGGPAVSWPSSSLSLTTSLSEMLGSPGPWGSCSNTNTHYSSSSKHLCTLHSSVASRRAPSVFAFKAAGEIRRSVPMAVRAALSSRRELTAC